MAVRDWNERTAFAQAALLAGDRVANGAVFPVWLDERRFWYERRGPEGIEYCLVDAASGTRSVLASRPAIARARAQHLGAPVDPDLVIVRNPRFDLDRNILAFQAYEASYAYACGTGSLARIEKTADVSWRASADGRSALVLRDFNLWLRDLPGGQERALTTDGTEYYAYGEPPAAMRGTRVRIGDASPEAAWSPDGRWILTLQTDDRDVPALSLAEYAPTDGARPRIHSNRTSLPGDPKVTEFRMLAIEVATARQVEARYPRLAAVRMNSTPFGAGLAWWSADGATAYFVDIERGEQAANVVAFDVATGRTHVLFTEQSNTYVEVGVNVYTPALVMPLPATGELVWYSERSGRGHLYLYDLATGALRNAITSGPWQVRDVLRVDERRREILFLAAGIEPSEGPYVVKPCAVSLDGGAVRVLSGAPGEHVVWRPNSMSLLMKRLEGMDPGAISGVSPAGDYFVETVSSVSALPHTVLRARDGREIATLEVGTADLPDGWTAPEPVCFKAADGATETFGLLFRPFGFDPAQRYPIIDLIYGGPQVSHVPRAHFGSGALGGIAYLDAMHLSALGAFVLILDGRGTAERERAFRTASHRAVHTASNLEDHVAALEQLGRAHPQIDLGRAGITGFSGGGYMSAIGAFRYGHVFKVAVAGGGNYDQTLFWHTWGERYHGLHDADHYASQAAKTYAAGLSGRILFVHGLMDEGCHPAALFQLVQALVEANRDADLVLLPRAGHEWTGYGLRRRWEYLATHLLGESPPHGAPFREPMDRIKERIRLNARAPERTPPPC